MKVKSESEVAQSCPTLSTPWTTAYQADSLPAEPRGKPVSLGFFSIENPEYFLNNKSINGYQNLFSLLLLTEYKLSNINAYSFAFFMLYHM